MTISIIDTSIFCELIGVPKMCDDRAWLAAEFRDRLEADEFFLLPVTTIIETGNHIGQNGSGGKRRAAAERFVKQVTLAIHGQTPFTMTPLPLLDDFTSWLANFPNHACRKDKKGKGSGFGDLTIQAEWTRQTRLHPSRRVYIWSRDLHLASYDSAGC